MEAIDRTNPAPPLTQMGTWTVTNQGPAAVSVTPASGSGSSQTFSFVFSDPNGYADIVSTQMLVNAAPSAANGCYVALSPAGSQFYLVNDASNGVLGPVTAGTATTLQNSRCILNAASSSASGAGTQLTINVALSFKPAFAGSKNVYMQATDSLNQTFALVAKGIFVVN